MDAEKMKLHAELSKKLQLARVDCLGIQPNGSVGIGGTSYQFYSKQFLYNLVTRLCRKHHFEINSETIEISEPIEVMVMGKSGEKKMLRTKVTKNYEVVDLDTGHSMRLVSIGEGQTDASADKSFQSASTACDTKFFVSFFRLTDKPDNKKKEEPIAEQPQPQVATRQQEQSDPPPPTVQPSAEKATPSEYRLYVPMFNSTGKKEVDNRQELLDYVDASMKKGTRIDAIITHLKEYRYNELDAYCINGLIHHNNGGKILLAKSKAGKGNLTTAAITEFCRILGQKPNGKTINDIVKAARQYIEQFDYSLEYHHFQGRILAKIVSEQPPTPPTQK